VLVLVVYLKIKKNKFLKKQVVVLAACCVFLHMVGVSPVELYLVCCVFLLVPEV
jgi:hypothetical protein